MKSRKAVSTQRRSTSTSEGKIQGQSNLLKKTKAQLIEELEQMRVRLSELGSADEALKKTDKALTKSVTHLHAILDAATEVGLITSDLRTKDTRILEFSTGAENIFDYQRDEVIGKPVALLHMPEEAVRLSTMFEAMRKHREGFTGEWTLVRKSGEEFPALFTTHPILDSDGNTVAALSIAVDISERVEAELALRESEERFRRLSDAAEEGIAIHDKGTIVQANEALAKMFGYELSEMIGMYAEQLATPESWQIILEKIATGYDKPYEGVGVRKDGSTFRCQLVGKPHEYKGKTLRVAVFRDITELEQAEERVEHLNLVLRSIREVNQLIVTEKDPERLIQGACDRLTHTRGYFGAWIVLVDRTGTPVTSAESGFGDDFATIAKQLKRGKLPKCGKLALAQSDVLEIKDRTRVCRGCPLWRKDEDIESMCVRMEHGQHIYGAIYVNLPATMATDAEEQTLFAELASDVALALHGIEEERERKRAEEALRESEGILRDIFDGITDGISFLDVDLNIMRVNTRMEQMYAKHMPLTGKKCYQAYQEREAPCPWCPSIPTIETGKSHSEIVPYPSAEEPKG